MSNLQSHTLLPTSEIVQYCFICILPSPFILIFLFNTKLRTQYNNNSILPKVFIMCQILVQTFGDFFSCEVLLYTVFRLLHRVVRHHIFKKDFIYLFVFRERGREGEREGEKHQCVRETSISCLFYAPNQGPGLQPRHVPSLGIEPATSWFTGLLSIH